MKILPLGSTEEPPQLLLLCRSHGHTGGTRGRGDKATLPTHTAPQGPTGDKETPVSPRERNSPNLRAAGAAAPTAEPNLASPRDPPAGDTAGPGHPGLGPAGFLFSCLFTKVLNKRIHSKPGGLCPRGRRGWGGPGGRSHLSQEQNPPSPQTARQLLVPPNCEQRNTTETKLSPRKNTNQPQHGCLGGKKKNIKNKKIQNAKTERGN